MSNPHTGPIKADSTTITFATWGSQQEMTLVNQQVQAFEQSHPTIHVVVRHIPENYLQKLHLLAAGNLMPDVLLLNSWHLPVFAQHGYLAPLGKPLGEDARAFYPAALRALTYGEAGLAAIPRDLSNLVMFINLDLLKQANIPPPKPDWTWTDLQTMSRQLCQWQASQTFSAHHKRYLWAINRQPSLFWLPWVWSAGGNVFNALGKLDIAEPPATKGLARYISATQPDATGCQSAPTAAQLGQATPTQWFLQQRLAMVVSGRWSVPLFRDQATFNWDIRPLPAGPAGSVTGIDATGYAMAARTQHPQAAWAFIRFMTSENQLATLAKSGLVVPARRTVAESPAFLTPHQAPVSSHVFLDVIATGHATPHHPRWGEIDAALLKALDPYWDTPVTPQQLQQALATVHAEPAHD